MHRAFDETEKNKMSIKLALLDNSEEYLGGLINFINANFPGEFEIHAFTNIVFAMNYVESSDMNLFVADSYFKVDVSRIPDGCKFAYFTSGEEIPGTVAKNAGAVEICNRFKQLVSGSEEAPDVVAEEKKQAKIAVFSSPCGGSGTSTLAAACARSFAKAGKKTLYLNLEKFGSSDIFFSSPLESFVKQDECGVYYCTSGGMANLNHEDIMNNVSEAKNSGVYDYIVIDVDFNLDAVEFYRMADVWLWCNDGSDIQLLKTSNAYDAFFAVSEELCNKVCLIYNKCSEKTSALCREDIKCIGSVPEIDIASSVEAAEDISVLSVFEEIMNLIPVAEIIAEEATEEPAEETAAETQTVREVETAEETAVEEVAEEEAAEPEAEAEPEHVLRPCLVRLSTNETVVIDKPYFTIGRSEDKDLNIADNKYIGHSHCHIVYRDGQFYVVDENSKNRTYIDGVMLEAETEYPICDGQTLKLANEQFTFRII